MQDGIEFGLIDIHVDAIRPEQRVRVVLAQLSDVNGDPREGGMRERSQIIDFNPGIGLREQGERSDTSSQE